MAEARYWRTERYSMSDSMGCVFVWACPMPPEELEDIVAWMELLKRRMARPAKGIEVNLDAPKDGTKEDR